MKNPLIVPGGAPFLLCRGSTGCLVVHGFTCMPEEMRPLGDALATRGITVLGIRLAGHGTTPRDLARTTWRDWMVSIEEGLALLSGLTERVFVIGLSLGGTLALLTAARTPLNGVIAMSSPYSIPPGSARLALRVISWLRPMMGKRGVDAHPQFGVRREADYPAYAAYPPTIVLEIAKLQRELTTQLRQIDVPVLLLHSRTDQVVGPRNSQRIYEELQTRDKELVFLQGMDHALVRDEKRDVVFDKIAAFIEEHS